MRITFVLPHITLSGGIRVLATYAERLQQRGHHVVVVSTGRSASRRRERLKRLLLRTAPEHQYTFFDDLPIEHRKLPQVGPVTDADVPDADVVVATWWATAPAVFALSAQKGAKAYFIQGYEADIPLVPRAQVDATWRLPMQKIVVASWLGEMARERFGDSTAIRVLNSVDTQLFFAPARGKQAVPTFGLIHSTMPLKGTDVAIRALEIARSRLPTLRVVCFGRTPEAAVPVPNWFDFVRDPAQESIRDLYASCDAFLQPSRREGFGLPILEAMACRTPVIATPAGAAADLLRGGGGLLVPGEDPAAMAAAIVDIAGMPETQWLELSQAAHAQATGYSWEEATDAFEAALFQTLSKQRTSSRRA